MPKLDPAYVAGIIDGEGCFNIHKNSNRVSYTARLMIGMVDPRVLILMCDTYGGSLQSVKSRTANSRDSWMWYATGKALEAVLVDVLDLLIIKKEQAELCLELRNDCKNRVPYIKGKKGTQPLTEEVIAGREALKKRVNVLNRVGKVA